MTLRDAWLAIAPVLGALNDGHVGLGFPEWLNQAPLNFPLRFALSDSDDALLVAIDHTQTIPLGSRVLSIDNVPGLLYSETTLAAFGAQTRSLHRARVTMSGAWTAIAMFGAKASYQVRWIEPDGTLKNAAIAAAPFHSGSSNVEPYTYRTLRNGSVGLIDYRSCEDLPRFRLSLVRRLKRSKRRRFRP